MRDRGGRRHARQHAEVGSLEAVVDVELLLDLHVIGHRRLRPFRYASMLRAKGAQVSLVSKRRAGEQDRAGGRALLITGAAVAAMAAVAYLVAVATHPMSTMLKGFDLQVYLDGGQQALHHSGNLYTWYFENHPGIQFTYTPFAALLFAVGSVVPFHALVALVAAVSTVALTATIWIAFRELGWRRWRGPGRRCCSPGWRSGQSRCSARCSSARSSWC